MKKISLLILLNICSFAFAKTYDEEVLPQTLISVNDTWAYYEAGNQPANDAQGDTWKDIDYDDALWASGIATFGYGDAQTTMLTNTPLTAYFRKTINITDPTLFSDIDLSAIRDDGMVVYLNGVEVWRDSMAAGTVDYNTFANFIVGGTDETTWINTNINNNLIVGNNTIAVEIHQVSATSSDLSFNFEMIANEVTAPTSDDLILEDTSWNYYEAGNEPSNDTQGDSWKDIAFDDTSWAVGNAELGYGDTQTTELTNTPLTAYFRKTFNVADISLYTALELEAIRDDGIVVYINGTEVWRDNMPVGVVDYNTFATGVVGDADETTFFSEIVMNNLVNGQNTIAVEVHQVSATSSDISFNFRMKGNFNVPAAIVRGPYLQSGTPGSIVVKWRTNTFTESIVNYGTSITTLNTDVTDNTLSLDHEVELTGLTPNTKYFYNLADASGVYVPAENEMYAQTSPMHGSQQFVRAWILGDPGTGDQNQEDVRDAYYNYADNASVNPTETDLMLFLGDNAYNDGTDDEYQASMFDIYGDMLKKSVAWSTLGNHDGFSANSNTESGPYYDIFTFPRAAEAGGIASGTEAYYSFDYANIHFIILESYTLSNDATQMAWCLNDIQSTTQDWIVAIFHHPAYTKGSHDSDSTNGDEAFMGQMRNNFLPILEDNGVDLVLSGHSHSYERSFFINGHYGLSDSFNLTTNTVGANGSLSGKADTADGAYEKDINESEGAVYITTGSAGRISGGTLDHEAMFTSLNQLGSCVMEVGPSAVSGQELNIKFITDTGAITDYFTINKSETTLSTIENLVQDNDILVYPVPANNLLNIKVNANEQLQTVKFYNIIGEVTKETSRAVINISNLSAGMYIVEISTDKNKVYKSIIIK